MPPNQELSSLISQFSEEVPATSPVFEGHLYLRTDKKQWQWRLFRFDGSSFTCLSTRKVKLPPNTPSQQTKPSQEPDRVLASYYQLPKFTIDIANISAVSMLKRPAKTNNHGICSAISIAPAPSKCFCVRTFDGQCFVMKAQKQKDLERWLFVLTKMWNFVQAVRTQINQQEPSQYDKRYKMPTLSFEKAHWIEEWRKSLAELIAYDPNIKITPPPIESIPDDDRMSVYSDMTSVSNRNPQNYGKPTKLAAPIELEMPLQQRTRSSLRKKRSDDVKNWI
ncbi:hypothetical protein CLU79DRAFT_699254, partial [Phycomyces nitens]